MITTRQILHYGVIAGLSIRDMWELAPGFILDAFARRAKYDQAMAMAGMAGKVGGLFGHK